jgi:hypothetical protein
MMSCVVTTVIKRSSISYSRIVHDSPTAPCYNHLCRGLRDPKGAGRAEGVLEAALRIRSGDTQLIIKRSSVSDFRSRYFIR